jgi:lycopene beta-cyclase
MDFRCDQTRGMHFIYCLPFSDQEALIESTLFSPGLAPADFYDAAITSYLKRICHLSAFEISRRESGVIPLGVLGRHDPGLVGIGANGGAIRPSSGYAFSFIQKQIDHAVSNAVAGKPLAVGVPHSAFELWMDRIFLAVLRRHPELAPDIFTAMAAALTGDEFARFLSGEAGVKTWAKVIMAMPKIPFLWGLMHPEAKAAA